MAQEDKRGGQTVAATFEGPLVSDAALTALKDAGFQPAQVAVQVAPASGEAGSGDDGAGARTGATIAGVVLGAIVGALLGRWLGSGTLALVLGAIIGAVVGAAIAGALARAGASAASTAARPSGATRPGSVTLTVTAESAAQAQQARAILAEKHGNVHA